METYEALVLIDHDISKALDLCKDEQLPDIFIPTYRNRKNTIISRLGEIPSGVRLFLYEDDRENYPKTFPENVKVTTITHKDFDDLGLKWRGLAQKRHFIMDWAWKNNVHEAIVIDDDVDFKAKVARNRGEKEKFVSLFDAMRLIVRDARMRSAVVAGPTGNDLKIGHFEWDRLFNPRARPTNCIYLNFDIAKAGGVQYSKTSDIQEDIDFDMSCFVAGLPVLEYEWVKYDFTIKIGQNSLASRPEQLANFDMVFYEKWKDYVDLYVRHGKDGSRKLLKKFNFKKIQMHDQSVNKYLYEACVARDRDRVIALLDDSQNLQGDVLTDINAL